MDPKRHHSSHDFNRWFGPIHRRWPLHGRARPPPPELGPSHKTCASLRRWTLRMSSVNTSCDQHIYRATSHRWVIQSSNLRNSATLHHFLLRKFPVYAHFLFMICGRDELFTVFSSIDDLIYDPKRIHMPHKHFCLIKQIINHVKLLS